MTSLTPTYSGPDSFSLDNSPAPLEAVGMREQATNLLDAAAQLGARQLAEPRSDGAGPIEDSAVELLLCMETSGPERDTAWAMSEANVEFVKGFLTGVPGMDQDQLLAALPELIRQGCDPEIEWIEDPQRADARTYRGHEGVLESWTQWLAGFEEWGWELEDIRDCGDRVLATVREEGRGQVSGASVSARLYMVMTFREGKVLRYQEFYDEAAALDAAGLSE